MANIALLNRCNLQCPYCFADNYLAKEDTDIDIKTFEDLLDFASLDKEIGIIGGEPLIHSDFSQLMNIAIEDFRFNKITVFTNGIHIDKHLDVLCNSRVHLLINVNSGEDIGEGNFRKIDKNIDILCQKGCFRNISLGINVYKENQDFSDFLYLVKKYGFGKIRLSVVIPQDKSGGIRYFIKMKPTLFSLYEKLKELNVSPCYDCNAIPECIYTKEEKEFLSSLPFANSFERDIFMGKRSVCSPVIDLYPDKTATRCFGCYDMEKVNIQEFQSIIDLKNYFFMQIDSRLVHNYSYEKCKTCYKHKTFGCFGGCLCYKIN